MTEFSHHDYEHFLYGLVQNYPEIKSSSLPHPEVPELADNFPHHRHEPPNIKRNRRPAPGISFQTTNLETLIADCMELGEELSPVQ